VTTPSRKQRKGGTAKRSIHFFRIDGGADDGGIPIAIDLRPALQKVNGLSFRDEAAGGRYVASGDADQCAWVDEIGEICKIRFANVRRNALPQAEADGELTDLPLADHAGICEVSHLAIFPDGIVGIEFNFYGPRPSRLAPYLRRSATAAQSSSLKPFCARTWLQYCSARRPFASWISTSADRISRSLSKPTPV
jgi:hypothetical protein